MVVTPVIIVRRSPDRQSVADSRLNCRSREEALRATVTVYVSKIGVILHRGSIDREILTWLRALTI